jgi:putative ABC transport system permease protein
MLTFADDLVARLEATPGVAAAAYANQLPLVQLRDTLRVSTTPGAGPPGAQGADVRVVSWRYFNALRIAILAGRGLAAGDAAGQPPVVVVNDALARREFGSAANAIGRQIYVGNQQAPWLVVGVVADVRQMALRTEPAPQFFMDARQWSPGLSPLFPLSPYYTLRVEGDGRAALAALRTVVQSADKQSVLFNLAWMEDIVSSSVARPRMYATLLACFAGVGLTLAIIGIYSVISYTVSQQTKEIGIRMALGAQPTLVLGQILRRALVLTLLGVVLGLAAATAVTDVLESLLFGLTPLDAATFAGMACLVTIAGVAAAAGPARRASRIDPMTAMRAE